MSLYPICPGVQLNSNPTTVVRLRIHKGVIVQNCDVYIGRRWTMGGWNLPASKWANPYTVKQCGTAEIACQYYLQYLLSRPDLLNQLEELRGKRLGCFCDVDRGAMCHGRILIYLLSLNGNYRI